MDKQKLQPVKGFRDFLPEEAQKRRYLFEKFEETFELFGFLPLETPALEYQEVLLDKYGEEADKLMFKFEDPGGRKVALRYDQTVPTARILAMYRNNLPMPWRRYQIQNAWRAEKPQKGRFREFLQCDVDIYGTDSPLADAEIVALCNALFKNLGVENFQIYINDRGILFKLMDYSSIPKDLQMRTIAEIDKLDRKSKDEVRKKLISLGLEDKSVDHLYEHLDTAKPTDRLKKVIEHANKLGVEEETISFQSRLARGLDYYTSTIFEIKIDEYKGGSVAGGGRYNNLIEKLSGYDIPAVGIAFGFDRMVEALEELKLFPDQGKRKSVLVTVFNKELLEMSTLVAKNLRDNGISAEIFPDEDTDLKKQLKYADKKNIKWLIVIGPEEVEKDMVVLKDLKSGHQEGVPLKKLAEQINKGFHD